MTTDDLKAEYYAATGTVSQLVRNLSFAGIAIIWAFKIGKQESGGIPYSADMALPLMLLVAALTCDLLQYVYQSIVWGALNTYYWRKYEDSSVELEISGKWNWASLVLFWSKAAFCVTAYGILLTVIYTHILPKGVAGVG